MSLCNGGIVKIATVPEHIMSILQAELNSWDYNNSTWKYDPAFGKHKCKVYYTDEVKIDIQYSPNIIPVIKWIESIGGPDSLAIRCFFNLMHPRQSFNLHVDTLKMHLLAKRFHIPMTLNTKCAYYTYEKTDNGWIETIHSMEYGYLYQLDNVRPHNVINKEGYRTNFICDVIPKSLVADGLLDTDPTQMSILSDIFKFGLNVTHQRSLHRGYL